MIRKLEHKPIDEALVDIAAHPEVDVNLSFAERSSLITARWAVNKFGKTLLDQAIREGYAQSPDTDTEGKPLSIEDTSNIAVRYRIEDAEDGVGDVVADLDGALRRLSRGYSLGQVSLHGVSDVSLILGSLEKSTKVNPDNLDPAELHLQASAQYMIDHTQVVQAEIGKSTSYLV